MNLFNKRTLLYIIAVIAMYIITIPSSIIYAQSGDAEEIFWGDDEEEISFDEDFDFSEDDESFDEDLEFSEDEDLEGFEFDDESFDDEFDDEGEDDEFADFSEDFSDEDVAEEEISISEAASRLGYTLSLIGASPGFVNHPLQTYNSSVDFRATFEFPMLLQIGPTRFRLGAEVGTFKFSNYKPIGGEFSGVHITGILSFPAGPGQVKVGGGMIGKGFGFIAENSYGFAIGDALDIRIGIRSTTALNVTDSNNNALGTVSWMDGLLVLGVSL